MELNEKVIKDIFENAKQVINAISKAFEELVNQIKPLIQAMSEYLSDKEHAKKKKFKPVLRIDPNIDYIRDKRMQPYFSRGNR